MKTQNFLTLLSSCIMTIMLCSGANGQTEAPCGQLWTTPLSEVEGKIVRIYYATPPFSDQEGLHFEISESSSGESVVIHVFPKNCVKNYPDKFEFQVGETVTVLGSFFAIDTASPRNICAAKIAQRPELQLRSLDTGCLNQDLCFNCQEICEEQCATKAQPKICMGICSLMCEFNIIPCKLKSPGKTPGL